MDFTLDLPYPWSLTPVDALQQLTGGLLPSFFGRALVAGLVGGVAYLSARQRPRFAIVAGALMGLLGWSLARASLPALAAVLIVWATVATYRGSPRAGTAKTAVVLMLRLLALLLTFLSVLRPAVVYRTENKVPSVLILGLDLSASMNFKDEYNNQTRFEAMQSVMKKCEPILQQLRDENQITVVTLGFAGDVNDWSPDAKAEGRSSDYGLLLASAYQRFGNEPNLRGFLIIGDGADNGRRYNAIAEARKWKSIQCTVNSFALGQTFQPQQKDLAITTLNVEPSPVFVKGRMILRANVDAVGCENSPITPHIYIDGKEVPIEKIAINGDEVALDEARLPLSTGNEVRIETTAPETPGEISLMLRIAPIVGEVTVANNEISTFVTVSKEGVNVLLVGPADEETKYIRQALSVDPRFRLYETTRQTDAPPAGNEVELFQFDRQAYDVIILRNVSAKRLSAGNPRVLSEIRKQVTEKGVGFMMMGGFDSFGGTPGMAGSGDWTGTPIEDLLPVKLNASGHIASEHIEFHPTNDGLQHFLLQLAGNSEETKAVWNRLNSKIWFKGINRLGDRKPTASVLATTEPDGKGDPILVAQSVGRGRTLAFAGDTTFLWRIYGLPDNTEGAEIHARFWKQTALWLAQQENSAGNVWVKPDFRRLATGQQQLFSVGVKGKSGLDLTGGKYEVRVTGPNGQSFPVPVRREGQFDRGQFWQTLQPGEYRIDVTGAAPDTDGRPVGGKASVRFVAYQDERELLQQAADLDFLGKVAAAGGGRSNPYRIDDLPDFLSKLKTATLPNQKVKIERFPDWRKRALTPFLPVWLLLFILILTLEWGLRRMWGMV
jgi:uncharacterized membrane protein